MKQVLLVVLVVVLTVGAMAAGAGIYKWGMVTPHPAPEPIPIPTPTPASTPEPTLNEWLIDGLLEGYVADSNVSDIDVRCIASKYPGPDNERRFNGGSLDLRYIDGKWTLYKSGSRCNGLETWEIDDATGAITYLGSSASP